MKRQDAGNRDAVMSKAERRALAHDAHLDDLLRFEDAGPPLPVVQGPRPWRLRVALQAFVASAVVYTAFHVINLAPPYVLILAVCGGAVLVRAAVASTAEPRWHRTQDIIAPPQPLRRIDPGGWHSDGDGMLDAVRRWERRLDWGATSPERFGASVSGRLGELADELLRQRHATSATVDPARARRLLGEELWSLLHRPVQPNPTPRELSAAIKRLESL